MAFPLLSKRSGKFREAVLETANRHRLNSRRGSVDAWHVVNIPVGILAKRRRDRRQLSEASTAKPFLDQERKEEKPPVIYCDHITAARLILFAQPLWRFRRAARIVLHLCRFCLAIAKKARDMTPSSADELLYFAAKSSEEENRMGFNKDKFKRESSVSMLAFQADMVGAKNCLLPRRDFLPGQKRC